MSLSRSAGRAANLGKTPRISVYEGAFGAGPRERPTYTTTSQSGTTHWSGLSVGIKASAGTAQHVILVLIPPGRLDVPALTWFGRQACLHLHQRPT